MGLLERESLFSRLEKGPIPPRRATEQAVRIAQGLAAAHEKGVFQRDPKSRNRWITKEGRLRILDFGRARKAQSPSPAADLWVIEDSAPGVPP